MKKDFIHKFLLKTITLSTLMLLTLAESWAQESGKLYPAPILSLDQFFSHHILVAEKSTHLLHLYKNNEGKPELVKSYQVVTGKKTGDKDSEGDLRTPEGIYNFIDFLTNKQLIEKSGAQGVIYGAGAFVTDYPNPFDQRMGKTGSGIWLHSTNDETRLDRGLDSKGCVVTANNDLLDVSKYLELYKTPMIIVQDLVFLNEKTHEAQRNGLQKTVDSWLSAWRNKDIENYMGHYHPQDFKDSKGNFAKYKAYKKAVFSNPGKPKIDLDNFSILQSKGYAVVTFVQKYQSNTINDSGKKILYLKQDNSYNWKIISEVFTRNGLEGNDKIAFEPSMRFFKDSSFKATSEAKKGSN
ncbi:MAG: L,D-transpeptidase family protein [Bacteriovorax sp.]|nr:L,D-transpeptidase family protein [Bacteriovorax sp.]